MADTPVEVVRDHPPLPQAPVDTSVHIPESVRRAAAHAESFYQAPPTNPPVQVDPATQPEPPVQVDPAPQPALGADVPVPPEQWEHRYHSMEGRFKKSQEQVTTLQEQVSALGDELVQTQRMVRAAPPAAPPAPVTPLITPADEEAYGKELIDLAQRAARQVIEPELNAVKAENANLRSRVAKTAHQGVTQTLTEQVPNWQEINANQKFKDWLRLPDLYSGVVRQKLLDDASRQANASRVVSFFKGFLQDEAAIGSTDLSPQPEPPASPAPRFAAVPLETLAAPGRAKPASGDTHVPVEKPVFTRAQISKFYTDVRRGLYAGREADKAALERDIFAAQNDGRVR